jgi:hypothetical protein
MNRHHETNARSQAQPRRIDADTEPQRQRRHAAAREALDHGDTWRKHPQRSLDAELSLLPLWRQPRGMR